MPRRAFWDGSAESKAVALFQKGLSGSSCPAFLANNTLDRFVTLPIAGKPPRYADR